MFSDASGQFEAIIFSEGLVRLRDVLEPGTAVVLMLQAGLEGEEVRARIGMAEPLEEAIAKHQKGMRIFLRDERPITSVYERLKARGEGEGLTEATVLAGARDEDALAAQALGQGGGQLEVGGIRLDGQ